MARQSLKQVTKGLAVAIAAGATLMSWSLSYIPVDGDVLKGSLYGGWDVLKNDSIAFLSADHTAKAFSRSYFKNPEGRLSETQPGRTRVFTIEGDTLSLHSEFMPGVRVTGKQERILATGDDGGLIQTVYSEQGMMGSGLYLNRFGFSTIHTDGRGMVITPEGDTIKDCMLVRREIIGAIELSDTIVPLPAALSAHDYTADSLTRVSKEYQWIVPGMNYPVAELEQHWLYSRGEKIDSTSTCVYIPLWALAEVESYEELPIVKEESKSVIASAGNYAGITDIRTSDGEEFSVKVWPTLIQDRVNIALSGISAETSGTITIYYSDGKQILTATGTDYSIDCSSWHPGTYLLMAKDGDNVNTIKLIKP